MIINRRYGRYTLLKRLGSGGMGEIFLATPGPASQATRANVVALKTIAPGRRDDPTFQAMFQVEADLAARLDHPNVVRLREVGASHDAPFMALELIHGHPLDEVLTALAARGERLDLATALSVAVQAARGLAYIHALRDHDGAPLEVVHRDVSPHNVMLSHDGAAKVFDFGIASVRGRVPAALEGAMVGKAAYMSPEQCRGERVDQRSDVFAMGVIVWELTCGRRLFDSANKLQIIQALTEAPIPTPSSAVPGYPPALEAVVMQALSKAPQTRTASCGALADALEGVAAQLGLRLDASAARPWMEHLYAGERGALDALIDAAQRTREAPAPELPASATPLPGALPVADTPARGVPNTPAPFHADAALREVVPAGVAAPTAAAGAPPDPLAGLDLPAPLPEVQSGAAFFGAQPAHAAVFIHDTPEDSHVGKWVALGVVLLLLVVGGAAAFALSGGGDAPAPTAAPASDALGVVVIETTPPGATIELNGRALSLTTPARVPGLILGESATLVLTAEGHRPSRHAVSPTFEQPEVAIAATLIPSDTIVDITEVGALRVLTSPPDAKLYLNGDLIASDTPIILEGIPAGISHNLRVTRDGYTGGALAFDLSEGEVKEVELELVEVPPSDAPPAAALADAKRFTYKLRQGDQVKAEDPRFKGARVAQITPKARKPRPKPKAAAPKDTTPKDTAPKDAAPATPDPKPAAPPDPKPAPPAKPKPRTKVIDGEPYPMMQ